MIGSKKHVGSLFSSKVEEDSCRTYNQDVMRSLVARKMLKNKTYYELKFVPTLVTPSILGQTLPHPSTARYLTNRNT